MTHKQMIKRVAELKDELSTVEEKVAEIEETEGSHQEWESLTNLYDQEYNLEQEINSTEIDWFRNRAHKAGSSSRANNIR